MAAINKKVEDLIANNKILIFSKISCGYCAIAKEVFTKHIKDKDFSRKDYTVVELLQEPDCNAMLTYLQRKTGSKSVPSVFINGEYIGGAKEVQALERKKQLLGIVHGEQTAVSTKTK